MALSRKSLVWLVLANYLFANTLAASLHDHGECCGATPGRVSCHGHAHPAGHHGQHCHHGKCLAGPGTAGRDCDRQHHRAAPASRLITPHHCVVCAFFAQMPLTPPVAEMVAGANLPADRCAFPALPVAQGAASVHLARGPPAVS